MGRHVDGRDQVFREHAPQCGAHGDLFEAVDGPHEAANHLVDAGHRQGVGVVAVDAADQRRERAGRRGRKYGVDRQRDRAICRCRLYPLEARLGSFRRQRSAMLERFEFLRCIDIAEQRVVVEVDIDPLQGVVPGVDLAPAALQEIAQVFQHAASREGEHRVRLVAGGGDRDLRAG